MNSSRLSEEISELNNELKSTKKSNEMLIKVEQDLEHRVTEMQDEIIKLEDKSEHKTSENLSEVQDESRNEDNSFKIASATIALLMCLFTLF